MSDEAYLTPEELHALKTTFYVQTKEMLEDFSARVLALEREAPDSSELLRALERVVHTIKGDSMALAFDLLAQLAHRLEDYFRALRESRSFGRQEIDLVLACGDAMMELLEAYCADPQKPLPEVQALCERLAPKDDPRTREVGLEEIGGRPFRLTVWFAKDCQMHS
ncbi:MAG: Hpt domain-containing protein, partial [Vicinamibacteria bacterium]